MINLSLFDSTRVHSEITLRTKMDSRMSFQEGMKQDGKLEQQWSQYPIFIIGCDTPS